MNLNQENFSKIIKFERVQQNVLVVDWVLGNYCNYNCRYCFPFSNLGNKRVPPLDVFLHNLEYFLDKIVENNYKVFFILSGGEPTVYNKFTELIKIIKHRIPNSIIEVVTNGSRTINWWEKNKELIDNVNLSFHVQFAKKEHFLSVIKTLKGKGLSILIMMHPEETLFQIGVEAHQYFIDNNILEYSSLGVNSLRDTENTKRGDIIFKYSKEQLAFLEKNFYLNTQVKRNNIMNHKSIAYDIDNNTYNFNLPQILNINPDFTGWKCSVGREHISINYDGYIIAMCGDKIFETKYNIYKDDLEMKKFDFPKNDITCTVGKCLCTGLYHVSKSKI